MCKEAQIVIESWRRHYNAVRPHASLSYKPPAPEVFVPALVAWADCTTQTRSDGHAPAGAKVAAKLTLQLDHSMGADQQRILPWWPQRECA